MLKLAHDFSMAAEIERGLISAPSEDAMGGESSERMRLKYPGEGTHPMHQETFELNCSRTSLAMDGTLVVVVEMSLLLCYPSVDRNRFFRSFTPV